jgi:hypothetical protein
MRLAHVAAAVLVSLACGACDESASHATPRHGRTTDLLVRRGLRTIPETRKIVFGEGSRGQLLEGWSTDEYDHEQDFPFVWATALDATVAFEVVEVTDEQFLVTLSAFPTTPPQTITVLVNGTEIHRFVAEPHYLEYRFVAPAAVLQHGTNRLTFRHSTLGEPPNAGQDWRRFAAAYRSILIGPQCLPLRAFGPPVEPGIVSVKANAVDMTVFELIGPLAIRRRVVVPRGAILQYRLSLAREAPSAAVATVRIDDGSATKTLVERVTRRWFRGTASREVEIDLAPWSGKTVNLELEVAPDLCRSAVTTAVLDRFAIRSSAATG